MKKNLKEANVLEQASNDDNVNVNIIINMYREHLHQIHKNNWLYKIWDERHNGPWQAREYF